MEGAIRERSPLCVFGFVRVIRYNHRDLFPFYFDCSFAWPSHTVDGPVHIGVHVLSYFSFTHPNYLKVAGRECRGRWIQLQHRKRRLKRKRDERHREHEAYIHTHVIIYIRIIL
jgi:hypothetical protein